MLRIQWSNSVKTDGVRKARPCLDGSVRAAPWLHVEGSTYAGCIEHPCMQMFFALAAGYGMYVTFADTHNAFQKGPPPTRQCYLEIDDAYESWYFKRYKKKLNRRSHVIPLHKAMQSHPEAGCLWETMITSVLRDLGFQNTTHERSIYCG